MNFRNLILSIAIHAAVISAAFCVFRGCRTGRNETIVIPVSVEVVGQKEPEAVASSPEKEPEESWQGESPMREEACAEAAELVYEKEPTASDEVTQGRVTAKPVLREAEGGEIRVATPSPIEGEIREATPSPVEIREATPSPVEIREATPSLPRFSAEPVLRVTPEYPRRARRQGREGRVEVEVTVTSAGKVSEVHLVKSSGSTDLDLAACEAARKSEFRPGTVDGTTCRLSFDFRLR